MQKAIELLGYGGVIPVAVAGTVMWVCHRVMPASGAGRYAAAIACGTAFWVGYVLLPDWAPLIPSRHWQWLPYLVLAGMFVGPISLAEGLAVVERWILLAALSVFAGWALVPSWSRIDPQAAYVFGIAGGILLLAANLDILARRVRPALFSATLATSTALAAGLIGALQSLKYGQMIAIGAAALAGCCLVAMFRRDTDMRSLAALYSVLAGGGAVIGFLGQDPVVWWMLLLPLAPLLLWAVPARFRLGGGTTADSAVPG